MEPSFPTHMSHGKMRESEIVRYIFILFPLFSSSAQCNPVKCTLILWYWCLFTFFFYCRRLLLTFHLFPCSPWTCTETPTKTTSSLDQEASFGDRQFMVIASEKQCRIIALPSQNCVYRLQITETDFVVRAEVISLKGQFWKIIYVAHIVSDASHECSALSLTLIPLCRWCTTLWELITKWTPQKAS